LIFNFETVHIPGIINILPDSLSRLCQSHFNPSPLQNNNKVNASLSGVGKCVKALPGDAPNLIGDSETTLHSFQASATQDPLNFKVDPILGTKLSNDSDCVDTNQENPGTSDSLEKDCFKSVYAVQVNKEGKLLIDENILFPSRNLDFIIKEGLDKECPAVDIRQRLCGELMLTEKRNLNLLMWVLIKLVPEKVMPTN